MKIRKLLAMLTAAAVITTSVPVYNLYAADEQTGEISEDTSGMVVQEHIRYLHRQEREQWSLTMGCMQYLFRTRWKWMEISGL